MYTVEKEIKYSGDSELHDIVRGTTRIKSCFSDFVCMINELIPVVSRNPRYTLFPSVYTYTIQYTRHLLHKYSRLSFTTEL